MDFSCSLRLYIHVSWWKDFFPQHVFFIFFSSFFLEKAKEKLKYEFLISHTWENVKKHFLLSAMCVYVWSYNEKWCLCGSFKREGGRMLHKVIKVQMLHFFLTFIYLKKLLQEGELKFGWNFHFRNVSTSKQNLKWCAFWSKVKVFVTLLKNVRNFFALKKWKWEKWSRNF